MDVAITNAEGRSILVRLLRRNKERIQFEKLSDSRSISMMWMI